MATIETLRLMLVSSDFSLLHLLGSTAKSNAWHLETSPSGWDAMERVRSGTKPHLLLLDTRPGGSESLHFVLWMRRLHPDLPVAVLCEPNDEDSQKEATRMGAEDVLLRPVNQKQLEVLVRRNLETSNDDAKADVAREDVESLGEDDFFLSVSPIMQKVRTQAELLAQTELPVLILGEPGSGKRTLARLIHKLSIHSGFPFLRVNCAAVARESLEAELFGKSHLAKDGRMHVSPGRFQLGERGTLLLEEITELPLSTQSRLLQVLQDRHFFRPSERLVQVDIRILATSGAKLDQALEEKKLLEDLYYRLSAFTVHVPPLRKRKEEVRVLLQHFVHYQAKQYGLPSRELSAQVIQACQSYSWPGNLVELRTFAKRYLVAGEREVVLNDIGAGHIGGHPKHGSSHIPNFDVQGIQSAEVSPKSLRSLIQDIKFETEKNAIGIALEKTGWNRKAAARLLNISYRSLLYKIQECRLAPKRARYFLAGAALPQSEVEKTGLADTGLAKKI